ncbi:MAG: hypothetical protein CM15mP88_3440 [Pseudomonadota bacterium]|nr:MAG: hypothetical protein CM15mP88_3440 [Pseudomonadota bacterium]
MPTHVQVQILEGYGHMVQMEAAMEVKPFDSPILGKLLRYSFSS